MPLGPLGVPDPHDNPLWGNVGQVNPFDESLANIAAAQQAQQVHHFPPPLAKSPVPNYAERARELFLKRMGGIRAELKVAKNDFLQCHIHGEVVHLFYCFDGKPGMVQEDIGIFPSDTLITQFRMILS